MRKAKGLRLLAAVLAAVVVTTGGSYSGTDDGRAATTAQVLVLEPNEECQPGYVCLWSGINQSGWGWAWAPGVGGGQSDFTKVYCPVADCGDPDFNDDASSWHNNSGYTSCVSWHIGGGDPDNTMPRGSRGNFTTDWNDEASSISFQGCP